MSKRTKLILLILGGAVFFILLISSILSVFSVQSDSPNGPNGENTENMAYSLVTLYPQAPIAIDASAQLKTDNAYYYDSELGDIETVYVKDGQYVKKGDVLFSYYQGKISNDVEDALRQQTRLYNQREELIDQLSKATGNYYNYQGDQISQYWTADGKQSYYVIESIGTATQMPDDSGSGASDLGIKEQIRQVNQQIEDVEIKLIRLKEQQHGRITAKYDGRVIVNEDGKFNKNVPLVRVLSDNVSITGSVDEYQFYLLHDDMPVSLYINAEDETIGGKMISYDTVPALQQAAEPSGATPGGSSSGSGARYGFTIIPDQFVQPGFSVKVNITLPGIAIPKEAIIQEGEQSFVFKYKDGTVHKQSVELVKQGVQKVAVKGVEEGEQLVMFPYDLVDGMSIDVQMNDVPMLEKGE